LWHHHLWAINEQKANIMGFGGGKEMQRFPLPLKSQKMHLGIPRITE
jgi:hypothetical protein